MQHVFSIFVDTLGLILALNIVLELSYNATAFGLEKFHVYAYEYIESKITKRRTKANFDLI